MAAMTGREIFEDFVPGRIEGDAELAAGIRATYEIEITGEGVWVLDFCGDSGTIREGRDPEADCFIWCEGDAVTGIMENPMYGLVLLMTRRLTIGGDYSLAEHLLKVFNPLRV